MATAQELAQNIGKRGQLRVAGTALTFEVEILDARNRYGNLDYKVRPTVGEGEAWHEATPQPEDWGMGRQTRPRGSVREDKDREG